MKFYIKKTFASVVLLHDLLCLFKSKPALKIIIDFMCVPTRAPNKKVSTIFTNVHINSHIRVRFRGRHNTPHNDIQQNDTQNNDTPHNNSQHNNKNATISTIPLNIMTRDTAMLSVANKLIFIFFVMLSVIMMSVMARFSLQFSLW